MKINLERDFATKANDVRKNANAACPEVKEQFLLQLSEMVKIGVKFLSPPNSSMLQGLALPKILSLKA